jgi:hypothetical protein
MCIDKEDKRYQDSKFRGQGDEDDPTKTNASQTFKKINHENRVPWKPLEGGYVSRKRLLVSNATEKQRELTTSSTT